MATSINADDSTDFSNDAAGGLIAAINSGKSTDSADPSILNYAKDGSIATAIDDVNSTDCAEDAAGRLIGVIDAVNSMDF